MSDGEHLAAGKGGKRLVLRVVDGEKLGTQVRAVELHQPGEAQPQILALESGGESAIGILIGGRRRPHPQPAPPRPPVAAGGGGRPWAPRLPAGVGPWPATVSFSPPL